MPEPTQAQVIARRVQKAMEGLTKREQDILITLSAASLNFNDATNPHVVFIAGWVAALTTAEENVEEFKTFRDSINACVRVAEVAISIQDKLNEDIDRGVFKPEGI